MQISKGYNVFAHICTDRQRFENLVSYGADQRSPSDEFRASTKPFPLLLVGAEGACSLELMAIGLGLKAKDSRLHAQQSTDREKWSDK